MRKRGSSLSTRRVGFGRSALKRLSALKRRAVPGRSDERDGPAPRPVLGRSEREPRAGLLRLSESKCRSVRERRPLLDPYSDAPPRVFGRELERAPELERPSLEPSKRAESPRGALLRLPGRLLVRDVGAAPLELEPERAPRPDERPSSSRSPRRATMSRR